METLLSDLQSWYDAQCDGEWEHCFGIKIESMDNPGWALTIELEETILEDKHFPQIENEQSKVSWIKCFVENKKFIGYASSFQLEELITTFLVWAKSEPDWLAVEYEDGRERK